MKQKFSKKEARKNSFSDSVKLFFSKIKKKLSFLKFLDPFFYVDNFLLPKINPGKKEWIEWIVYALTAFVSAFAVYAMLGFLWGTASPMVIVYSGSMEPTFYRGDIMGLISFSVQKSGLNPPIEVNQDSLKGISLYSIAKPVYEKNGGVIQIKEISFDSGIVLSVKKEGPVIVYYSDYLQKPIIHRAIALLHAKDGYYVLTKGDSIYNSTVDQDCGKVVYGMPEHECIALYPVPVSEIQGMAFLKIPLLGYAKLLVFDDLPNFLFGKKNTTV